MSTNTGPALAHRTVSSIRAAREVSPNSPHTPIRSLSSGQISSPSSLRADDDVLVIELGCRRLRVGFAGDPVPKRIVSFEGKQARRAGDFRAWEAGYEDDWRKRASGQAWGWEQQLWQLDVRGQDLGLVGDKIERGLREALVKYLLIDSKPRKMVLVLPPAIQIPILSSVLDTLFNRFGTPTISLVSSPVMTAFAAGVRSALVVDIGWHETVITAVCEYREVHTWRTIRAGKLLIEKTKNFLVEAIEGRPTPEGEDEQAPDDVVRFEECEEVATRILWCKKAHNPPSQEFPEGLPTLHEQDESEPVDPAEDTTPTRIHLTSCNPPRTLLIPFSRLSEPCETTFFETRYSPACFDDHEFPLHLLVYRSLLQLPLDVRAMCMSRVIFTGGCSAIPGLKGRIFDEVSLLAQERGWDPIRGKGVEAYKKNPKLQRTNTPPKQVNTDGSSTSIPVVAQQQQQQTPTITETTPAGGTTISDTSSPPPTAVINPADVPRQPDQVEDHIRQEKGYKPPIRGILRAIDSMGPWCGASLASQLKIPALAVVEKDLWAQQGVNGASKPSEIDVQAIQKSQRQSMGAGGLMRGSQMSSWTLGVWSTV
ncbi:actin-related protein RO7 [Pseudomassariella vexata]|uniref:Actin-related protein RO7 n=1 Tax=Pseudomassariella vexata TaxID=1141098 RepID=A0A1Y2DXY0_9PEZI|nr:actin-related protein RO7 [Pseudomassariella vexata]ORY63966.1 actin-related protein RO7 [Pseudomassariella vexata]